MVIILCLDGGAILEIKPIRTLEMMKWKMNIEQVVERHQIIWETTLRKVFISGEKGKIFLSETVFARGRSKAVCTLCLACDPAQQQHSFGTNNK